MEKRNRKMMRCFVLLAAVLLGTAVTYAGNLRGSTVDAATKDALIQASVRVLARNDSALVKGAVTNDRGRFTIENLRAGKYILEVSYVGYTTVYQDFTMGEGNKTLEPVAMTESSYMLREAVVTGIRTPMKVMEDTVEFSAESYKTRPNAVVEDLLKRLPGVEVDSEGKITANGQSVSKILVDGKEFFSDDPTVASRNLPVDMVEKLQVVQRKSDLARITGVDDGEEETVINLTVKKGMKNGWFGNAEAGYGTDSRYKANFNVNRFKNDNQFTILGAANNINDPGFADGAGARFRRFGGDNGLTRSNSLGMNFNVGKGEIFRVGGNVMYSNTDRDTRTSSDRTYQFLEQDSTSNVRSSKYARDKGHNIRADFRVQWKPDSFNTFDFRPNVSLNFNRSFSNESSQTFAGDSKHTEVTRSINVNNSKGNSYEFGGTMIYNHNFRSRPGRSFSVFARYNFSDVREKADTYSWNRFFLLDDSEDIYDQYSDNHTWSNNVSARVSWTEPLGDSSKGHFLTLAYRASYRWNNADKLTYDKPVDGEDIPQYGDAIEPTDGMVFDDELSNRFRNTYFNQDIRLGYRHVSKKGNLNAGISLVPQSSQSRNLIDNAKDIPRRDVFNVAPFLRFRYKFSKTRSTSIDYNGRTSQPSMTQLQPVADMSNPLRIVIGNPNLNPTFTHNLRLRFQDFNQEAQRSVMAMVDASVAQNSIVQKTTFNSETGGQTTTYENVNGVWNVRGMNMVSLPFRNKAFTFNNHIFLNYSQGKSFNNGMETTNNSFSVGESFGLAWRPDNLELEIRPNYNMQYSNVAARSANKVVHRYGGSFYGTYSTPIGIVLNTDLNFSATSGYSQGYDATTWMWNASISYEFLKGRNAAVTLRAYDLLNQNKNIRRSTSNNYIDDTRYNSLSRYVMLSVSYKFTTFGKGEQPGRGNFDGPDGPRHGRPAGPPPGGMRGRPF